MDIEILARIIFSTGLVMGLFSLYCLYRLWEYGPFNANLIFQMALPFAEWGSVVLVAIGVGLLWKSWWIFVISAILYFIALRVVQFLYVRQKDRQVRK